MKNLSQLIGKSESTTIEWKPSLSQVNEINKVSDKTAFLELKDLLDKNILTKEGSGRATVYRLKR